jgi:hypothetical protein
MTLLPGGAILVAGYKSDKLTGMLAWYQDGELVHEIEEVRAEGQNFSFFYDVAVAPSGDFAVAVGGAGVSPKNTTLWIYEFEI